MANWKASLPRDNWSDLEKGNFAREVWTRLKFGRFDWTPPPVAAGDTQNFIAADDPGADINTAQVVGLRVGMAVHVAAPDALNFGLCVSSMVTANDTLMIQVQNFGLVLATPPAGGWAYMGVVI